jgi:hypothetical protein
MIRHLKHRFNILYTLIALLFLAAIPSNTVFAISDPTSGSGIKNYHVYRNYIQSNDLLFIIEYDLKYDPLPTESPNSSFEIYITSGLSSARTTVANRSVQFYEYAFGIVYMSTAEVTTVFGATPTTTGWQYSGNPATPTDYSDDLEVFLSGIAPIPFSSLTPGQNKFSRTIKTDDTATWVGGAVVPTLADTREDVGQRILDIMEKAEEETGTEFLNATDLGVRLNTAGAEVVLRILPIARTLSPEIFSFSSSVPAYTPVPKTNAGQNALLNNKSPALTTSLDNLGTAVFGSSGKGMLIGGIGFLLIGISVLGMIFNVTQAVTPAMVLGIPLIMSGVILGVIPMAMAFLVFFFVLLLFGLTFLMSRLA